MPSETPFGTQTPSTPPEPKKSRGALWLFVGLLVAGGLAGGGFVASQKFGLLESSTPAAAAPAPEAPVTPPPAESAEPEPPAASPPTAQSAEEEGESIDLSELDVEKKTAPAAVRGPRRPIPSTKPEPKQKEPKETTKPAPTTSSKKPSGWVPPPITDPGF